jgi:hypothetical protein
MLVTELVEKLICQRIHESLTDDMDFETASLISILISEERMPDESFKSFKDDINSKIHMLRVLEMREAVIFDSTLNERLLSVALVLADGKIGSAILILYYFHYLVMGIPKDLQIHLLTIEVFKRGKWISSEKLSQIWDETKIDYINKNIPTGYILKGDNLIDKSVCSISLLTNKSEDYRKLKYIYDSGGKLTYKEIYDQFNQSHEDLSNFCIKFNLKYDLDGSHITFDLKL